MHDDYTFMFDLARGEVYSQSAQWRWLEMWEERSGGDLIYQGCVGLTDKGDRVMVTVIGMSDEDIIEFQMRYNATVKEGDNTQWELTSKFR